MSALEGNPLLIIIGGPTASGKTSLSIELAQELNTEIISADSRQCYRELSIGTAKPSPEERSLVRHHFVDSHSIHEKFSAGLFANQAHNLLEQLFMTNRTVIATGGTGLYLKALTGNIDQLPSVPSSFREVAANLYRTEGIEGLREYVNKHDPEYYLKVDIQNPARLIRAAEVIMSSGRPYSSFLGKQKPELPWKANSFALSMNREELYTRINQRVDRMMEQGLEAEVRSLLPFREHQARQTVGYRELFDYFDGRTGLTESVESIKQHSRNFAKRQITWFRNQGEYQFMSAREIKETVLKLKS